MALTEAFDSEEDFNPLDRIERIAEAYEWSFDRTTHSEVNMRIEGGWCDLTVSLTQLLGEFSQSMHQFGRHPSKIFRQDEQTIATPLGQHEHSVLRLHPMQEDISIDEIVLVAGR